MINLYILSERFFIKYKGLSDAKVVSITNKEYGFQYIYGFHPNHQSLDTLL